MKKLIFSFLLIGLSLNSLTFDVRNTCSCSQLSQQAECAYASPICTWDSNSSSCSKQSCSKIADQEHCAMNLDCMWKDTSCVDYTLCNQITGTTEKECFSKSRNCPGSDGSKCTGTDTLQSCSQRSNSTACIGYVSTKGVCIWDSTSSACNVLSTCSQLNNTACTSIQGTCIWNVTQNACTQSSCAQYTSNSTCTNYLLQFNQFNYQLCQWNATNSTCQSANDASQLTSATCYNNTRQTYSWSSSKSTCVICFSNIINLTLLLILVIMI